MPGFSAPQLQTCDTTENFNGRWRKRWVWSAQYSTRRPLTRNKQEAKAFCQKTTFTRMQKKKAVLLQRWPRGCMSGSNEPLCRYGHSKFSKMVGGCHLWFDVTRNSSIRSSDPENPTLEPNMKCIGSPVAEIWPFVYLGACGTPILRGREGRGQRWHHSKERWWFVIGSPLWLLRYL